MMLIKKGLIIIIIMVLPMIDIHSHILPAVDDGSKNEGESLLMLKAAIRDGIHTIVATPHFNYKSANDKEKVLAEVKRLTQMIEKTNLEVEVLPGQEIRIYGEMLEDYEAGKLLTIGGNTNYMLVEFPFRRVPHYAEKLIYNMEVVGVKTVIAHPERNQELLEHPEKLYNLVAKGALTQLTASSLIGYYGKGIRKFSQQLIEANLVHTIATDAHNTTTRTFNLSEAYEVIMKKYGSDYVSYFKENAQLMIENQPVYDGGAQPIGRKKFLGIF